MEATVSSNIVAALIGGGVLMFISLIGVAWRLGGLETAIKDMDKRLGGIERRMDDDDNREAWDRRVSDWNKAQRQANAKRAREGRGTPPTPQGP